MLTISGPDMPFLGLIYYLDIAPVLVLVHHLLISHMHKYFCTPCTLCWPCEGAVCFRHSKSALVLWCGCWILLYCDPIVACEDGAEGLGVPKGMYRSTHISLKTISAPRISHLYKQMGGLTFAVASNLCTRVRLVLFLVFLFTTMDNHCLICWLQKAFS